MAPMSGPASSGDVIDERRDRRALRAVAVQFFVNGAVFASFLPRLPEIRDRVDLDVGGIGLLMSLAGVAGLAASAGVGPAISRYGTRRVMIGAGVLLASALPFVGLARTPVVLLCGLAAMSGLDVLVETHDEVELARALAVGATLIGVNQRDLVTFEVDHERARRMGSVMPRGVVSVAESGVRGPDDAAALAAAGYNAVLVGESLVTSGDPGAAVAALVEAGRCS